jgi:mannonate dehydratase
MKRRQFLTLAAGTAAVAGCNRTARDAAAAAEKKPVAMHLGCQRSPTNDEMLEFFKRHGVDHVCGYPEIRDKERGHWTEPELAGTRELCESYGVKLDMVALPILKSSHIDREKRGAIMLGQDPQRQRDVEDLQKCVEACAKVGVPAVKYNLSLLGVVRTGKTPGRGGSQYSTWKLAKAKPSPALTRAGRVTAELAWERITWFLERFIPVCEHNKVRAACHPHDPGMPPEGYQGVTRVLGTVDGLKKLITIKESPYHGVNLCLGTVAEMLRDPATEIHDVIRYFGARKKIFNVHFRNLRGRRDDFQEVYLDEGDLNMAAVARTLWEVGYAGMVMPDHVPTHADDEGRYQAYAHGYGYIKGLLQALA